MRIALVPVDGGQPYPVTLPMTLVGSKPGCDFRLEDEAVPALCCVLVWADDLLFLRDLETDTIRVNGQPVRRAVLIAGDRLTIAGREFRVQDERGGS
jgi:hypothetical protein